MLNRNKVIEALERKREQFRAFIESQAEEQKTFSQFFEKFRRLDSQTILDRLQELDEEWPGALPTAEMDAADRLRLAFTPQWRNHQEARTWALATLYHRPVIAVDGSQITPTKDLVPPVGAVQVGWFINPHQEAGANGAHPYVKNVEFEILAPDELGDDQEDEQSGFPSWRVNQERFVRECRKLCELMGAHAAAPEAERPLCFFDGSFIISFAGQLRPARAQPYIDAVQQMLDCSARHRVPLVGFVDSAYSRDLVTLVNLLEGQNLRQTTDARLLRPVLARWGDRSPLFFCARSDQLSRERRTPFYQEVGFTYVHLVQDRPPARLEMPRWLHEAGRVEEVVDLVRAECVIGMGYPYALETADAVAVIGGQDQAAFYRTFQQFLDQEGLSLSATRKLRSKRSRR